MTLTRTGGATRTGTRCNSFIHSFILPYTTGQPAHKRAKIPRSNKRTIEDTQLYTYSQSDVRKAAEEEIRQMKKKRIFF